MAPVYNVGNESYPRKGKEKKRKERKKEDRVRGEEMDQDGSGMENC